METLKQKYENEICSMKSEAAHSVDDLCDMNVSNQNSHNNAKTFQEKLTECCSL